MRAEIISVGTELLLGEIVDTNAAWIAQELKTRGVNIYWKTVVGDNLDRIREALERGLSRSDLIIVGGGLGPTDDDLSREGIAAVLGETPTEDAAYLEQLRAFFEARGRSMPETNRKQAWLIPSAEALENPVGTAPGWYVRVPGGPHAGRVIVAMPGPPHEMKRMWRDQVLPRLALPENALFTRTYRTALIGESHIAERLGDLTRAANPSVATYARRDGVHVRVAASAATLEDAARLAALVAATVERALDGYAYGTDEDTLAAAVGRLLAERGQSVAALESLTGGLVTDLLTDVPGASRYVRGGAVTYPNDVKRDFGVDAATLDAHGAVSRETALEMARAARERLAAAWGVATTGVAGPDAVEGKPAGLAFVAIAGPDGERAHELRFTGERRFVKERVAMSALGLLWRRLVGKEPA